MVRERGKVDVLVTNGTIRELTGGRFPVGVTELAESAFEEITVLVADLSAAPIRELLHSKLTIELSVTPGRDDPDMVTPAVMEPFTPERRRRIIPSTAPSAACCLTSRGSGCCGVP